MSSPYPDGLRGRYSRWQDRRAGTKKLKATATLLRQDLKRADKGYLEQVGAARMTPADLQALAQGNMLGQFDAGQQAAGQAASANAAAQLQAAGPRPGRTLNPARALANGFRRRRNIRRGRKALKAAYAQMYRDAKQMRPDIREAAGRSDMTPADLQMLAQGHIDQVFRPDSVAAQMVAAQQAQAQQAAPQAQQAAPQAVPTQDQITQLQAEIARVDAEQVQLQAQLAQVQAEHAALQAQLTQLQAQLAQPQQTGPTQAQTQGQQGPAQPAPAHPTPGTAQPAPAQPAQGTAQPAPGTAQPATSAPSQAQAGQQPAVQQFSSYGQADFDAYIAARDAQLQARADAQYANAPGPQPTVEFFNNGGQPDHELNARYAAMQEQARLNYEQAQAQNGPQAPAAAQTAAPGQYGVADGQFAGDQAEPQQGADPALQPEPTAEEHTARWNDVAAGNGTPELGDLQEPAAAEAGAQTTGQVAGPATNVQQWAPDRETVGPHVDGAGQSQADLKGRPVSQGQANAAAGPATNAQQWTPDRETVGAHNDGTPENQADLKGELSKVIHVAQSGTTQATGAVKGQPGESGAAVDETQGNGRHRGRPETRTHTHRKGPGGAEV